MLSYEGKKLWLQSVTSALMVKHEDLNYGRIETLVITLI